VELDVRFQEFCVHRRDRDFEIIAGLGAFSTMLDAAESALPRERVRKARQGDGDAHPDLPRLPGRQARKVPV
jgi:hypothetical protein